MSATAVAAPGRTPAALAAWGLLGVAAAAVLWNLIRFWGSNSEYLDRWLILVGSAWLVWRDRPVWQALPARPTRFGLVPLTAGAMLFPPGWFLALQVAPKPILL